MPRFVTTSFAILLLNLLFSSVSFAQNEFQLNESYSLPEKGIIDLKSEGANIRVLGTDKDQTTLKAVYRVDTKGLKIGNKEPVELNVTNRGDSLVIREKDQKGTRVLLGTKSVEYTITITAPKSLNLELKGKDNNYFVRDIAGYINIKAEKSQVDLQNCTGNEFTFDLQNTNLDMSQGQGSLTLKMDKGVARLHEAAFEVMGINADKAEINLYSHLSDNSNYVIDLDGGSLLFQILDGGGTFNIKHNNQRILSSGNFMVPVNSQNETIYKLDGGDATINIDSENSKINLEVAGYTTNSK